MIGLNIRAARRIVPFIHPRCSPDDFWPLVFVVLISFFIALFFLVWIGYFEE